jgi:hypothetical protein
VDVDGRSAVAAEEAEVIASQRLLLTCSDQGEKTISRP